MIKKLFLLLAAAALCGIARGGNVTTYPSVSSVTGSDLFFDWQGGAQQNCTATQLQVYLTGGGTLNISTGKTVTIPNTLTLSGTDGSSIAFGTGGTVLYNSAIGSTVQGYGANLSTLSALAAPGTNGYVLSSTSTGTYSWKAVQGPTVIAAVTGTNTYVATPSPALTGYTTGMLVLGTFAHANTGAATLNLNGLGAVPILLNGSALSTGVITAGGVETLCYDGSNFNLLVSPFSLPIATTSLLGGIKPDGATITVNGSTGVATVPTATTSSLGLVKPDGTTITILGGVISSTGGFTPPYDFESATTLFTAGSQPVIGIDSNGNPFLQSLTGNVDLGFDSNGSLMFDNNVLLDISTTPVQLNYPGLGSSSPLADGSGNLYSSAIHAAPSTPIWANPSSRIIYDQYNENAISTVSDSWNTDSETTLISDPDYGYVSVNGSLIVRQSIQLQSYGGSTTLQLNNDGSIAIGGNSLVDAGGNLYYSSGDSLTDGGSFYFPDFSHGTYDSSASYGSLGQYLQSSAPGVSWSYLQYANGSQLTDSSSNLYYSTGAVMADSGGNFYFPPGSGSIYDSSNATGSIGQYLGGDGLWETLNYTDGSPLTDGLATLYYPGANQKLANNSGTLFYSNGNTLADGVNIYFPTGGELADSSGNVYGGGGSGILFLNQGSTSAFAGAYSKGALYFDITLNRLCVGGATTWEAVTTSVASPATSTSAGTPGQMATDGTYLYVCTGASAWKRILLTTF